MRSVLLSLGFLSLAATAQAQHAHPPSPYAGQEGREIKALSVEEIAQLRNGEGMGLALAAELNHYPGPRHALELAHGLELSAAQVREVEGIREAMSQEARRLGELIIGKERQLDQAFGRATIDETALRTLAVEIARLQGNLRFAHLRAHLQVRALLSADQVKRYDELRGLRALKGYGSESCSTGEAG